MSNAWYAGPAGVQPALFAVACLAAPASALASASAPAPGATLGVTGALVADTDKSVTLDGSSGYGMVRHAGSLNVGNTFSIEAWVKRTATQSTVQTIVQKGGAGSGFKLGFAANNKLTLYRNGTAIVASTTTQTDTSVFHHYVVTKATTTVKLYVDEVDVTDVVSATNDIVDTGNNLYIGADQGTGEFLSGTIDDVSFYSSALSAATVANHHGFFTVSALTSRRSCGSNPPPSPPRSLTPTTPRPAEATGASD
jgi:hypothetical protein